MVCNICSHALQSGVRRLPPSNGQERSGLQHLESCTGVCVGKTPPLLMGRREVVCKIWSLALEFGWLRLPPCYCSEGKWFATSGVIHWSFGLEDSPLLMSRRKVICSVFSRALKFGWVRLPPSE